MDPTSGMRYDELSVKVSGQLLGVNEKPNSKGNPDVIASSDSRASGSHAAACHHV